MRQNALPPQTILALRTPMLRDSAYRFPGQGSGLYWSEAAELFRNQLQNDRCADRGGRPVMICKRRLRCLVQPDEAPCFV